jgi:hypothetical protein
MSHLAEPKLSVRRVPRAQVRREPRVMRENPDEWLGDVVDVREGSSSLARV